MKKISLMLLTLMAVQFSRGQEATRVITTGVPFLLVAADARSAALGDQGVATSTDAFSQQYNPAKFSFALSEQAASVSYTPYLTSLVNDISLSQVTYYNRINERSAFAGSFRYFSLGEIELRQTGDPQENFYTAKPNEFAFDGSYSLKLSERFSMAVAGRFINSSLKIPGPDGDATAANTFAFDVAGYYQSEEIAYEDFNGRWRAGFNFQNMGPKINYDNTQVSSNFLPANMRLGGGFDFILDEYNKIAVNAEVTKLMVPTPQEPKDLDGDGEISQPEREQNRNEYNSIGWVEGIFQSFNDAPDGFSEELKEFTYSLGSEYSYQDSFAMRLGYFHESPMKGARRFFALGAGFKYSAVVVDLSYLFSTSQVKNPLENTLRFTLTFNFGDTYDEN